MHCRQWLGTELLNLIPKYILFFKTYIIFYYIILMIKVVKIKTDLTPDRNEEILTNLTSEDKLSLSDLELYIAFDQVNENLITSYLVGNDINIEKVKQHLIKFGVTYTLEDITSKFVTDDSLESIEVLLKLTPEDIID